MSRSTEKADAAVAAVRESAGPDAKVESVLLDLADLDSVAAGAAAIRESCPKIDALINNAGVMQMQHHMGLAQTPQLQTKQGFELQIGTNHFGHFKLNSLLIDHLEASPSRIVVVSSIAHKMTSGGVATGTVRDGKATLEDLDWKARQGPPPSYRRTTQPKRTFSPSLQTYCVSTTASTARMKHSPFMDSDKYVMITNRLFSDEFAVFGGRLGMRFLHNQPTVEHTRCALLQRIQMHNLELTMAPLLLVTAEVLSGKAQWTQ
eukprot:gene11110-2015_t